jgi:hypothetical protein
MSALIDIKEIERKATYAAFQDGLMEIFLGVFLFFFGGTLVTNGTLAPFIVCAVVFANPAYKKVKERYIIPRTGYVKLPQEDNNEAKGIGIATVIFIVFLLGSMGLTMRIMGKDAGLDFWMTYILPPSTGFMMAIGPFWLGQTYGLMRGYVLAGLFLLSGIAMPVFKIASGYEAVGLMCTIIGLVTLIVGGVMFSRFLRKYPASEVTVE